MHTSERCPKGGEHDGVENNENENISKILGFVKYLRKSNFFIQCKIAKWRSNKPFTDREFWDAFNYFENALKEAKKQGKTELPIPALSTLDEAYCILMDDINPDISNAPLYVVKYLYLPAYQEMIDSYKIKIIPVY